MASSSIMLEDQPEILSLENRILELCQDQTDGITDQVIMKDLPDCSPQQRVTAINKLLSSGKIDLLRSGNKLIYKLKDLDTAGLTKGADHQEKVIYQIIKDAGNKGIWIRDIRYKSNLLLTQVNKILKNLESKKLIKAVKSVAQSKKKVYMLYDLEPAQSVTGGAWYSDQDFESEFVEVLNQQCYKFLEQRAAIARETKTDPIAQRNASFTPLHDVWKFISELGISKVQLTKEDIETILNTLIYDGKLERSIVASAGAAGDSTGQTKLYRAVNPLVETTGLMRMPCGSCPVFDRCYERGSVSPMKCIYMKDWLDS